jgi:hypothetical protein
MKIVVSIISIFHSFIPVATALPFSNFFRLSFVLFWFIFPYLKQHDADFSSPIKDMFNFSQKRQKLAVVLK